MWQLRCIMSVQNKQVMHLIAAEQDISETSKSFEGRQIPTVRRA